jgi:LmbE family N-acetylglucosaminyl deacetylase
MGVRHIIITLIVLTSLTRIDQRRAKELTRGVAIRLCRRLLGWVSRPYRLCTGPCVVFAPHQDDETLGCGGLIARKRNEGLPVHVVFITDGGASHPGHPLLSGAEIIRRRHAEALAALAVLGVESCAIHFLNEPDGTLHHLSADRESTLVDKISRLLVEIQPEEIFLPCSPDGSSEHDAAFTVISRSLTTTGLRPDVWQYPVWSWWNPMLLIERMIFTDGHCFQATEDFRPIKALALGNYRTQIEPQAPWRHPALPPELVRIFNSDAEYFFRFILPPPGLDAGPRVI